MEAQPLVRCALPYVFFSCTFGNIMNLRMHENCFPDSVICPSKLTEHQERSVGTSVYGQSVCQLAKRENNLGQVTNI